MRIAESVQLPLSLNSIISSCEVAAYDWAIECEGWEALAVRIRLRKQGAPDRMSIASLTPATGGEQSWRAYPAAREA